MNGNIYIHFLSNLKFCIDIKYFLLKELFITMIFTLVTTIKY